MSLFWYDVVRQCGLHHFEVVFWKLVQSTNVKGGFLHFYNLFLSIYPDVKSEFLITNEIKLVLNLKINWTCGLWWASLNAKFNSIWENICKFQAY